MIYSVSWISLAEARQVSPWGGSPKYKIGDWFYPKKELAEFIKSSKDDTFLFGLGKIQNSWDTFQEWVDKYELKDYIVVESKGVYNPVHPERPNNLKLVVMQSLDHFQRKDRNV